MSVAYNFGEEIPVMVSVETDLNSSSNISKIILQNFDFRPQAIIERLDLKNTKYLPTATYGHFTNFSYPWERIVELVWSIDKSYCFITDRTRGCYGFV